MRTELWFLTWRSPAAGGKRALGAPEILLLGLLCGGDVLFQNIALDGLSSKTIFKEINAQDKKKTCVLNIIFDASF